MSRFVHPASYAPLFFVLGALLGLASIVVIPKPNASFVVADLCVGSPFEDDQLWDFQTFLSPPDLNHLPDCYQCDVPNPQPRKSLCNGFLGEISGRRIWLMARPVSRAGECSTIDYTAYGDDIAWSSIEVTLNGEEVDVMPEVGDGYALLGSIVAP